MCGRPGTRATRAAGLVGYGVGGYFHAPFVAVRKGRAAGRRGHRSPDRRAELAADFPAAPAYDSLAELLAAGVDAVTITTPPQTRRALVLEAIAAGVPTIADKPFAPTRRGPAASWWPWPGTRGSLNVFDNRRWDADIGTLAAVLRGVPTRAWCRSGRFRRFRSEAPRERCRPPSTRVQHVADRSADDVLVFKPVSSNPPRPTSSTRPSLSHVKKAASGAG